jgi:hypothetical protein
MKEKKTMIVKKRGKEGNKKERKEGRKKLRKAKKRKR